MRPASSRAWGFPTESYEEEDRDEPQADDNGQRDEETTEHGTEPTYSGTRIRSVATYLKLFWTSLAN